MSEWLQTLTGVKQVFAYIALPATVILVLQTILLFFGIGDGGVDTDVSDVGGLGNGDISGDAVDSEFSGGDADGLAVFSIRGIVAMLCIGGWSGIVFIDAGLSNLLSIILAVVLGISALFGMAFLMRFLTRLQSSGNIIVENAVGKIGKVYLTIPSQMKGSGKINITIQDTYTEFDAVTFDLSEIKTGETVYVESVDEVGRLIVRRINQ